uniref:Uncharacterized protein n=1 Tax=Strigamia maritima TaxID=126957 RepID=T1J0X6_STRMM
MKYQLVMIAFVCLRLSLSASAFADFDDDEGSSPSSKLAAICAAADGLTNPRKNSKCLALHIKNSI